MTRGLVVVEIRNCNSWHKEERMGLVKHKPSERRKPSRDNEQRSIKEGLNWTGVNRTENWQWTGVNRTEKK